MRVVFVLPDGRRVFVEAGALPEPHDQIEIWDRGEQHAYKVTNDRPVWELEIAGAYAERLKCRAYTIRIRVETV